MTEPTQVTPELVAAYATTRIELRWPDGTVTLLRARGDGAVVGAFPDGIESVQVITACNPGSRELAPAENVRRNRALSAALDARGWLHVPADGHSPDGTWHEPGFGVIDQDGDNVLALAGRHGQLAVFRWTPSELAVVWTLPTVEAISRGWEAEWRSAVR